MRSNNESNIRLPGRIVVAAGLVILAGGLIGCLGEQSPLEPRAVHLLAGKPGAQPETQRPLSDFLSAQGSTSMFFPPFPDFVAWTNNNPQTRFAAIDYTGLVAAYLQSHGGPSLGTQVSGSVSERPLADGRAEVTVDLRTTRAMSWAVGLPGDIMNDPPIFGYRQGELLANPSLTPALSSSELNVVFTNDAPGAPLPDLVTAFILGNATPGQQLLKLMFRSSGSGPLRGSSEGALAHLTVTQTGLLITGFHGATADAFPAERVDLHLIGKTVTP